MDASRDPRSNLTSSDGEHSSDPPSPAVGTEPASSASIILIPVDSEEESLAEFEAEQSAPSSARRIDFLDDLALNVFSAEELSSDGAQPTASLPLAEADDVAAVLDEDSAAFLSEAVLPGASITPRRGRSFSFRSKMLVAGAAVLLAVAAGVARLDIIGEPSKTAPERVVRSLPPPAAKPVESRPLAPVVPPAPIEQDSAQPVRPPLPEPSSAIARGTSETIRGDGSKPASQSGLTRETTTQAPPRNAPPVPSILSSVVTPVPSPGAADVAPTTVSPPPESLGSVPVPAAPQELAAATRPTAASVVPPAVAVPPVPAVASESVGIQRVLTQYQNAFSALDIGATQAVWPTVDAKALAKAFDQLDDQVFDLHACTFNVTGTRAVATCDGTARYVPKVGSKSARVERRRWKFNLHQVNESWVIDKVEAR